MDARANLMIGLLLLVLSRPAFAVPIPDGDTIIVENRKWAQVDLFTNLSWNDVNQVCPGGICGPGKLNGYDMAGWRWATQDDANDLFNFYIRPYFPEFLLLGPTRFGAADSGPAPWVSEFLSDGWRVTFTQPAPTRGAIHTGVDGRLSTLRDPMYARRATFQTYSDDRSHFVDTGYMAPLDSAWSGSGVWFFQPVSTPPTLALMLLMLPLCGRRVLGRDV